MTIDEAIKHCIEQAEIQDKLSQSKWLNDVRINQCIECAADHRQLAEWLTELKEAKRLLKLAVDDMSEENFCAKVCKRDNFACRVSDTCDFKWRYADDALKLLGGSENG